MEWDWMDPSDVENEFSRVFGRPAEVLRGRKDNTEVLVLVEGWIEPVWYNAGKALNVLCKLGDGEGKTEEGDAEVCRALQEAGAFLGFDREGG